MRVKDVMSLNLKIAEIESNLKQAAEIMRKNNIGALPVGKKDKVTGFKITGFITDRDITINAISKGKDPSNTPVKSVMTKNVITCTEEDNLKKASEKMAKKKVRRLLVVNKEKVVTGIISLGDISRKTNDPKMCGQTLKAIAKRR